MNSKQIATSFLLILLLNQCNAIFYDWFIPFDMENTNNWLERTYNETIRPINEKLNQLKENMQKLKNELQKFDNSSSSFISYENETQEYYSMGGCSCVNMSCSCCAHVSVEKLNLNDTACLNLTYLTRDVGIQVTFDINGNVYYNQTVSESNPPDVCVAIPEFKEAASVCLKFYDLVVRNTSLSGCVDLIAKLVGVEVARVKIGCLRAAPNSQYYQQSVVSIHLKGNATYFNQFNSDTAHQSTFSSSSSSSFSNNWFGDFFLFKKKRSV